MTWIFCAGMIRAGSTLQYQMASSLIEHNGCGRRLKYVPESEFESIFIKHSEDVGLKVVKVHVCTDALRVFVNQSDSQIIYTHRDIRDVAVSAMRKFDLSFDDLMRLGWLDQAIKDYYAWTTMPNVLVSRYDEMFGNLKHELSRIATFLGISIDVNVLTNLAKQHELPMQKQKISALKNRVGKAIRQSDILFDENELLHHNHIYKGEVGGWIHILTPIQKEVLTERYGQWLTEQGYSANPI